MLASDERIRLLSLVDIFEPLSAEEIEQLNGQLPDVHLKRGEIFYSPKDRSERLFVLWKGRGRYSERWPLPPNSCRRPTRRPCKSRRSPSSAARTWSA